MSMNAPAPHDEILRTLRANRDELLRRPAISEDDTRALLIEPFLEYLGHAASHRRSEHEFRGHRPDEVIYRDPVSLSPDRFASIVLEAKSLGTVFDRQTGAGRANTPARQISRYLRHHEASGPGTFGVLTDGDRYRLLRRTPHGADVETIGEWRILDDAPVGDDAPAGEPHPIETLAAHIHRDALGIPPAIVARDRPGAALADAIAAGHGPDSLLELLTVASGRTRPITEELTITGRILDADENDWQEHAWRRGAELATDTPDMEGNRLTVAVIRFTTPRPELPQELPRGDVAFAASTFAAAAANRASVVVAYQVGDDGLVDRARVAVHHKRHTGMTPEFDPHNPPPSVLRSLSQVQAALHDTGPVAPERLTRAVEARTIRNEFYESVARWTRAAQSGKEAEERQVVLRHLIRTVFAWILKEDGFIPSEIFEEAFAKLHAQGEYHSSVLSFLFHNRLNTPEDERESHPRPAIDAALDDAPFLNGSLFAVHPGDDQLALADDAYFGTDAGAPGLFTIMSRYDWSTSEHTHVESDQTIDPEMLSNLFENLIAATETWLREPDRMPAGTYYTPADVATEMVKDALVDAIKDVAPRRSTDEELRTLFGDPDSTLHSMLSPREKRRIHERLTQIKFFDPAVGSGEFPYVALNAILTSLPTLGDFRSTGDATRWIIENHLHGQDINPMATQITRLRLYIAIMAAERELPPGQTRRPLPNLEARIVCADTLATDARPEWRPARTGNLLGESAPIKSALTALAEVRRRWLGAQTEEDKARVRREDADARQGLLDALEQSGNGDDPELREFASKPLLELTGPISADARLLFYDPDWDGFDVVIGNPPYERIGSSLTAPERARVRKSLAKKNYQSVGGGDLYNLFCETALALAKPDGGVVTLVVPLSLSFGQNKRSARELFERRARRIRLRHQDNRPDTTFHDSPVAHRESRQRTTIITAVTGGRRRAIIETSGASRWASAERELYLLHRGYVRPPALPRRLDARLSGQWPRIPTEPVRDLVSAMLAHRRTLDSLAPPNGADGPAIAFPRSAYNFITALPAGRLDRRERVHPLADTDALELAMALLNGHAAYAWWRIWGDAFDLNPYEMTSVPIPDAWLDDDATNRRARELGRALIDSIVPENIDVQTSGTRGRVIQNVNFHNACPDIVRHCDELYLSALDGLQDATLAHLRVMRSNSNWRFS